MQLLFSQAAAVEGATVSCQISLESDVVKRGEAPAVLVTLRNDGGEAIVLPGCLDGSDAEKRYPHCRFEVFDAKGVAVDVSTNHKCGNLGGLFEQCFVRLQPGESFDPTAGDFFIPNHLRRIANLAPGMYELRFVYVTEKSGIEGYMGVERRLDQPNPFITTPAVRASYAAMPAVRVVSNRVPFRVE